MDEQSFTDRLLKCAGDTDLLREYAEWLIARNDFRGNHLAAELDVYEAEMRMAQAETQLSGYRGRRPQDFEWLNTVLPMITKAPITGTFYASPTPNEPPCVQPGMFCNRDTVVGIVEALKVFYHVPAGHNGVVTDVFVDNGASVAAGDPLIKLIRPQKPPEAISSSS